MAASSIYRGCPCVCKIVVCSNWVRGLVISAAFSWIEDAASRAWMAGRRMFRRLPSVIRLAAGGVDSEVQGSGLASPHRFRLSSLDGTPSQTRTRRWSLSCHFPG